MGLVLGYLTGEYVRLDCLRMYFFRNFSVFFGRRKEFLFEIIGGVRGKVEVRSFLVVKFGLGVRGMMGKD